MTESKERRVATIMGEGFKFHGHFGQWFIRQRIQELLDELGLVYSRYRSPICCHFVSKRGGGKNNNIEVHTLPPSSEIEWNSDWFPDNELPEKEQDLLIWLAEKGEKE